MHCVMCGEFFPPPGVKDYVYKKLEEEDMPRKRKCRNCGRLMNIVGDDLCGGCYFAVRGMTKGTPEYDAALAAAKKRFSDPNYKPTRGGARKGTGPKPKVEKKYKELPTLKTIKPKTEKPLTSLTALDMLIAERNMHQAKVFQINKAIEILS